MRSRALRVTSAALSLLGALMACAQAPPAAGLPSPSTTPAPTPGASSPAATPGLSPPGPLHFSVRTQASALEAPWALAFGKDGTIWVTERPGRVRIVRNGQLLAAPALTLSVVSQPGCEGGLLGIAVAEPNVYLYYTHASASGNLNRISRFTISGDRLTNETVLLDGIPGGTCFHFGGRLKLGPDGLLYATTGEGFVASRAASPTNLSGKILRLKTDGSGLQIFAWGFRNPQGIAFDAGGRLYASNHGPTGEFGLCCHDSVYLVQQGGFHGWPAWAGNVATGYAAGGLPPHVAPVAESGSTVWAPSGIAFFSARPTEEAVLLVAELRGQALRRLVIDPGDPAHVLSQQVVLTGYGRLREVVTGPDGCAYVLTSNRDGRGSPASQDDRLLQLCAA